MIHYRLHHDPRSSHGQIVQIVRTLGRSPVLDVGSAQGMLGQLLAGSGLEIDAVEPNPVWADAARPHYHTVHTGTIETASLPGKHYQVVVCADVLEHTVDPVAVLNQLRTHATDDAAFIISLPNVAHLAVRLMLLFGLFPRMQRGILDKTHLHFFTRRTVIDTLREAGLRVDQISATGVPLEELWRSGRPRWLFGVVRQVQWAFVRLLPSLFGFQWIVQARPM